MGEITAVTIHVGNASYEALIGRGLLATIGQRLVPLVRGPRCAIVADTNTAKLYANVVIASLRDANFEPTLITVAAGEGSKSLHQAGLVCDEMAAAKLDRASFVIALGGGVVGDLAGFAAAIYHRGIAHVQVPTTLLAQVDSSIGGKTAVNTAGGKNLLGSVHQPALVVADVDTLRTLPARELNQGFAEIVKHAVIADASLFSLLRNGVQIDMADLVHRNVAIKARVVARDERDTTGERAILNFGHTVGHAIERAAGYGMLLHGEAISLGMVAACSISMRHAGLSETDNETVLEALKTFDLPTQLQVGFPRERIMPALLSDKKFEAGQIRFVVTPGLGFARLTSEVTLDDIAAAVAAL